MPFLPQGTNIEFAKGTPAQIPEPKPVDEGPSPGFLDVAAAAERTANLAGTLWEHYGYTGIDYASGGGPAPKHETEGFDPLVSIPKGYEAFAPKFLWAKSAQDIETQRGWIDQEIQDRKTIARAGGWGVAATFAAGLTDPLSIASMAIPAAAPTRIGNVLRFAGINAFTTAAQEVAEQSLTATRSREESLLNVGASAVLGGLLGTIAPRVPSKALRDLRESVEANGVDPAGSANIIDQRLRPGPRPDAEASNIAQELRAKINAKGESLRAIVEGEEGKAAANLEPNTVEAGLRSWTKRRDELAAQLMEEKGSQIAAEAERIKQGPGVLESLRRRYAMTDVEDIVRQRAAETVEASRAETQKELDAANEAVAAHEKNAELLKKVESARIDLEQHNFGLKEAKSMEDLAQLLPEGQRGLFERRLAALPVPEFTIGDRLPPTDTGLPQAPLGMIAGQGESTVGASAVHGQTMEDMTVAKGARSLVAGPGRVAPTGRLINSVSLKARELLENLANLGFGLNKNDVGEATATPIERLLWRHEGVWQQGVDARAAAFKAYRERLAAEGGASALSRRDFMNEVTYAMRRGDKHAIPEVAKAAQDTRKLIFDPLYNRAKALGLMPEEANLFAESYVMRQYDAQAIQADQKGWHQLLSDHFVGQGLERGEADDVAHQVTRNILHSERGTMDWKILEGIVPESGQLKERTLSLPDAKLEPYLNSDIDNLTHSYIRSLAPEVEMTERFGSRDLADQIQGIKDEYAILKQRALAAGDNAKANELDKALASDLTDVQAIRDRLYGVYGMPKDPSSFFVRAGRLLRANNVLRLLGGATISHIPDFANVITRYGLPQTFEAVARMASSLDAVQMTRAEAHRLGVGLDMAMNTISLLGDFGSHSQFAEQRIANKMTRMFTMATGETPLVTAVQMLASTIGQNEILRSAERLAGGQAVDRNLMIRMAQAGIDEPMLQRIAKEFAENGTKVNGLRFGMSDVWKDKTAALAFETAILKDAHGMTLRPSVGDTPLLMSTELGKALLQFKTFAFASGNTVVNPMAQGLVRGDPRAIAGIMALAGAGTMSYMTKQWMAGQPIETDNPGRFALEVLDKSNLLSWTGEAIFPALWQFGFKDLSRWSDRDPIETLLGPAVGTATSTLARQLPAKLTGNQEEPGQTFNRSDLHFLRRTFLPGQNLWYFRRAVNATEDHVGDMFDLPGTSNAERLLQHAQ